jgi:hypothetical protein
MNNNLYWVEWERGGYGELMTLDEAIRVAVEDSNSHRIAMIRQDGDTLPRAVRSRLRIGLVTPDSLGHSEAIRQVRVAGMLTQVVTPHQRRALGKGHTVEGRFILNDYGRAYLAHLEAQDMIVRREMARIAETCFWFVVLVAPLVAL